MLNNAPIPPIKAAEIKSVFPKVKNIKIYFDSYIFKIIAIDFYNRT